MRESVRPGGNYGRFVRRVEPVLRLTPRVHRLARPPVLGDAQTPTVPIEVMPETEAAADGLRRATASWVAIAEPGTRLAGLALERLGQAISLSPDATVITSDHDELIYGRRRNPTFKPGPSPELALCNELAGPLLCVRRDEAAAALQGEAPDALLQSLLLRLGGPDGGAHAHVPMVLAHCGRPRSEHGLAGVVRAVLRARGEARAVVEELGRGRLRVRRAVRREPSVEVIVPFRDRAELLDRVSAGVLRETAWDNLRLTLVDNGSEEAETREVLERLRRDRRVRVCRDDGPFNFAALNNRAARASDADYVLFLNNDVEVLEPGWIEDLLEEAQRREIGAVAPLLLYPDGTVQHSGAALGLHGYAGHPFAGLQPDKRTAFGSAAQGTRNWLAVTAACLLTARSKFDAVGGFDERFVVAGNDVDLCLRLLAAGYRSICVPYARLIHDEGRSRGEHIDPGDFAASERSYGEFRTVGDPYYNPNLTLCRTDCSLRRPDEL